MSVDHLREVGRLFQNQDQAFGCVEEPKTVKNAARVSAIILMLLDPCVSHALGVTSQTYKIHCDSSIILTHSCAIKLATPL